MRPICYLIIALKFSPALNQETSLKNKFFVTKDLQKTAWSLWPLKTAAQSQAQAVVFGPSLGLGEIRVTMRCSLCSSPIQLDTTSAFLEG